jgi:hypothetical protein
VRFDVTGDRFALGSLGTGAACPGDAQDGSHQKKGPMARPSRCGIRDPGMGGLVQQPEASSWKNRVHPAGGA